MSLRNGIVLFLALSALLFLFGCGGSTNSVTAPPSGGCANQPSESHQHDRCSAAVRRTQPVDAGRKHFRAGSP